MYKKLLSLFVILLLAATALAQDGEMMTPSLTVNDQISTDGTVLVADAVSEGFGWVVIHADSGEGTPGPVIGFRSITPGMNFNIIVPIDTVNTTPTLFAMLHEDTGEIGAYEFGMVEGADAPVAVDGEVVVTPFSVNAMSALDQFADDGSVMLQSVTTGQNGWVVIHADSGEGAPGPVIGQMFVMAGTTLDVSVPLESEPTNTVFPMLHVDTGEEGTYEFGMVEGADAPVVVDGEVAVFGISTVPAMRVRDQIVLPSDAMMPEDFTPELVADQVLSPESGWLVVHADGGGQPGQVLGFAPVSAGINQDVIVELDLENTTPVLYPMLHVDTGEPQVYEFGQVEGADLPVTVEGNVLTFPINGSPFIDYNATMEGNTITIPHALIDAPGWVVIHADSGEGTPGPVIGFAPLLQNLNVDIPVEVDPEGMTDTVFAMLHYDNTTAGEYEFGMVDGADGPVIVQGNVVVGPLQFDDGSME